MRPLLPPALLALALACHRTDPGKGHVPVTGDDDDAHSGVPTTTTPPPPPAVPPWSRDEVRTPGSVAITELAYHRPGDDLEWLELHNPAVVDLELTGWSLAGAVDYAFPAGARIPARGYLVVASDPGRLDTEAGVPGALGPWTGRLDDDGERVELFSNGGRRIDSVRYGVDDPWPPGADGTGYTLAKIRADGPGDRAEAWRTSREPGGTPGAPNGVDPLAPPTVLTLVPGDASWSYDASGAAAAGWADPGYDDSAWLAGEAPFSVGTGAPAAATLRFTADNDCAVYLGRADGSDLRLVGEDTVGDWTTPKVVAADVAPTDHLFVTAWEAGFSDGGPQMVIAEVELPSGTIGTTAAGFEWALGPAGAAPDVGPGPSPSESEVAAVVAAADLAGGWAAPAVEAPPPSAPWGGVLGAAFDPATQYVWPDTFDSVSVTNAETTWALFRSTTPLGANGGRTELPAAPTTSRFRVGFDFAGDPASTELTFDCDVDDGAVFFLNGAEVLRHHLPAGPVGDATLATAEVTDDPSLVAIVPGDALLEGPNVLAVEVHQATAAPDEDLLFGCTVVARTGPAAAGTPPLLLHEVPAAGTTPPWIELAATRAVDPAGFVLGSSAGEEWPVRAGALDAGDLVTLDLDAPPESGDVVFLADADGTFLDALRVGDRGWGRTGAEGPWRVPSGPTPGVENAIDVQRDVIINELAYHRAPVTEDGAPFEERPDEWIELYNRGPEPVDLSGWQLVDAVRFVIPEGIVLAPDAYVVIANRARSLRQEEPGVTVLGDFEGALDDATDRVVLRDAVGNPVDEVRYYDGGRWPDAADGGGSTLERLDPWADGSAAEAWGASDESARTAWADHEVSGFAQPSAVGPDGVWDELVLGLLDEGEVLIDDLSVVRDPLGAAVEMLPNGSFDDTAGWRIIGNHRHSSIVADPDDPGNAVLRLVATGPTEHMHNHAETTLRAPIAAVPYQIRFRARWVSGSNALHTRLYFQRLPHVTHVARPAAGWGTPGRANSRRVANLGPTFSDLRQEIPVPLPGEAVPVRVTAADPDGVAAVTLWSSVSGAPFAASPMSPGEGGAWEGSLAGQPAGTVVQFYVEGEDGRGATATFPREGPDSRALVRFDGGSLPAGLHGVRLILTDADSDWLHDPVNLMSNDRLGATVVLDDARVVYDVGVRAKGSERGRPQTVRLGYGLQFPRETPFRGSQRSVLLDRSQGVQFGQREFLLNLVAGRVGLVSAEYNDLGWAVTPRPEHTGSVELQIDRLSDLVLDNQFTGGADGPEYDYELIYYPYTTDDGTPTGQKLPQPDGVVGTAITDLGSDPEAYRWNFELQNHTDRDDFQPILDLGQTFALPDAAFAATADSVIDVDQWLRGFAFATMAGAVDNYGGDGAQHNARFYQRPDDQRILYFPHDLDFFGGSTMAVVGNGDLRRLISHPLRRRIYYQHLFDVIDRGFDPATLDAWCAEVGTLLPAQDFAGNCREMHDRADWVLSGASDSVLRQYPVVAFAITTNGGADFVSASPDAVVEGDGWIDVRDVW